MKKSIVSIVKSETKETPDRYSSTDLSTVKGMVEKSFELLGGMRSVIGDAKTVMIKPNLVEVPYPTTGGSVVTDPRVLEALILVLKEYGVQKVQVGEGKSVNLKHIASGARKAFEESGLAAVIRRAGGEVVAWDEEPFIEKEVPGGELLSKVRVPKSILEADLFINVPKLKTHCQTEITIGIKSMQGVYSAEDKVHHHNEAFPWKMIDIIRVAKPHLTLVDGLICGEDYGPIYTSPIKMDLIVASHDVVAVDAVCSKIMGIDPDEVPITRLAHTEGIGVGDLSQIEVVGQSIESVRKNFRRTAIWNPVGFHKNVKIFAGGACRFCLAQVGAAVKRLQLDGELDSLEEICVIIGHRAPAPVRKFKNTYIIGDCARDSKVEGEFIGGCPPLPSVQIVHKFLQHKKRG
ncbi:MAG: hypothetical protein Kow009_01590 [Spirochaetales bacterium]